MSALPLSFSTADLAHRTNTSPRPALPALRSITRYHLAGKVGYGFELVQALPVDVEKDRDGSYLISDPVFGVYGHGTTEDEAFADFSVSLVEYRDILATGANPETKTVLAHLATYLRRERAQR